MYGIMVDLVFYTKRHCPLCDRLRALMIDCVGSEWPLRMSITDVYIETDAELMKKYALRIPVVVHNDHILFEGRPDPETVRNALERIGVVVA